MRKPLMLLAGAAAAVTVAATAMAPALADPPTHAAVHNFDLVGIGADTTESLFNQLSVDYNASQVAAHHPDSASNPFLYSWDATNPTTQAIQDPITLKSGCASLARPDGSSAGIGTLTAENAKDGTVGSGASKRTTFCVDFARSARDRSTSDPIYGKGGVAFIALGGDAITYATQPGSAAPKSLTTHQLFEIYTCTVTNWKQVGGKSAPIHAFIPETGSGIRTSFLTAIGIPSGGSPGACVSDEATKKDPAGNLQQNEGVNVQLNKDKPDVIVPYSVAKYLAQTYHSAKCLLAFCKVETSGASKGLVCVPKKGQDQFGCDAHGTLVLNKINGTAPATPFPLPKPGGVKVPTLNPGFTALFDITQYAVVSFSTAAGSSNGVAPYLRQFFGPHGWLCSNKTAKTDLTNYGFRVFGPGTSNGHSITACGDTH